MTCPVYDACLVHFQSLPSLKIGMLRLWDGLRAKSAWAVPPDVTVPQTTVLGDSFLTTRPTHHWGAPKHIHPGVIENNVIHLKGRKHIELWAVVSLVVVQ